ncbi:MAG: hypothetical protein ACOY5Y_17810 [Pseudomonadota bacterium]
MAHSGEGRETLGFFAAALSGPVVLGAILGLTRGFTSESLQMTAGALFFCTGPGVLLGMPVYYTIRKVRVPGRWWTTAFGAAVSAVPVTAFVAVIRYSMPPGVPESARSLLVAVIALAALACGAVGGFVFWSLVFRRPVAEPLP